MENAEENLDDVMDKVEKGYVRGGGAEAENQKLQDFHQKFGMFTY